MVVCQRMVYATTMITRAPRRFRLIVLLAAFLVGASIGSWFYGPNLGVVGFGAVCLFIGIAIVAKPYAIGVVGGGIACMLIGYIVAQSALQYITLPSPEAYQGEATVVSVRTVRPPQQRALLKLVSGPHQGQIIRAYVYDWAYPVGSRIAIRADLTPTQHRSDYGAGVSALARDLVVQGEISPPGDVARFRAHLEQRLGATLPEPYASLAVGLITGAGDNFDPNFKEDLQRTGTTHIVAVSGYNLTIVALFLRRLGQRRSRRLGFALALGSILLYVVLAGATPSMLRGASVSMLSLSALMYGRLTHRLPLVLGAAVLLLLIHPLGMAYSLSWQLSFLAFVGILFWPAVLEPVFSRVAGKFGLLGVETISAEIMVLPLLLYRFGVLSLISPLVNILVLSLVPLAMLASGLQAGVALGAIPLGRLLAWVTFPLLWLIVQPIEWLSQLPFAAVTLPRFSFLVLLLAYAGIGLGFWYLERKVHYVTT